MPEITLALGGGGSKGYAHLGVIRGLEKLGYQIRAIAGSSAGGMAGVVYGLGFSPGQILEKLSDFDQDNLYGFGRGRGLLASRGLTSILQEFLGDKTFADLKIPVAVTAVDLISMREVILDEGPLLDAVLATAAVPGLFQPQPWENYLLVDGVVLNPVPVAAARQLYASAPVVAVVLTPEPESWAEASPWDAEPTSPLLRPISRLRVAKAFEVYLRSMEMTTHMLAETRLALESPALLIRPDVSGIGSLDRVDIPTVVELGEKALMAAESELRELISKRGFFKRIFKA